MTVRGLLVVGRWLAAVSVVAMIVVLAVGLRLVTVEGRRGDAVIVLQAQIDALSARADDLALNGAMPDQLAAFLAEAEAIRGAMSRLDGHADTRRAAANQVTALEALLVAMAGPDGSIVSPPGLEGSYRDRLDALANAGGVLDAAVLDLLQVQKAVIIKRVWTVALALVALGLALLAIFTVMLSWLERSIVTPIGRLTAVIDRMRDGDMTARAPATGSNELAILGRHINEMADGRATIEARIRDALSREETLNAILCRTQTIGQLGGWHADLLSDIVTWDRQTCTIFEVGPEDATGPIDAFFSRVDPRDRDRVANIQLQQLEAGQHLDFQHRIVTPSGIKWVWERAEVVRDEDGSPVALDGTVQDITHLKEIEQELEGAQKDAARSAALLRIAGRTARFGGWSYSVDQDRVEWTPETATIHDEPPGTQPSVKQGLSYYDPVDRQRIKAAFEACVTDGYDYNDVFRLRTAKGRKIWVRITGEAVRDAQGKVIEVHGACQDITDLIAARSEADRRNAELEGVISSMQDSFVMMGEDGKVAFLNQRAREMLGLGPKIREGTHLAKALEVAADGSMQAQLRVILGKRRIRSTLLRNNETGACVEVALQTIGARKVMIARDVSAERRAQRRLLLLDAALQEIDDIVLIIEVGPPDPSVEMTVVYANNALKRITGMDPDEILNRSPRSRFPEETEAQRAALDYLDDAVRNRRAASADLFTYGAEEALIWLQVQLFPLEDPVSGLSYIVAIERDITEERAKEERAFHSAKLEAIGQLTGGVAHDFNNLLTIILGNADMLHDMIDEEEPRSRVEAMIAAAERGARLTDSMLAFSRRTPLRPAPTDINLLLEQSHSLLLQAVPENIEIILSLDAERPVAEVDGARLQAAIVNLVLNGRDAIDGHGHITLATDNIEVAAEDSLGLPDVGAGPFLVITVSDDGTGIGPDVLPLVFEPFFTTKPVGAGTGLGLSTVYGFAKQSGGHVHIYSEPGLGTTVRLYLPCRDGAQAAGPGTDTGDALPQGRGEHILVVEDDPALLDYVTRQLGRLQYRVTSARDAGEALKVLARDGGIFDLLFTDVILPGEMNGGVLADRARDMHPGLKVLFTSGYTRSALDRQGRIAEDVKLLNKPYRLSDLARSLREAVEA